MPVRGVRGATVVSSDQPDVIREATREMLEAILEANPGLQLEDLSCALFTLTEDLKAAFPPEAARSIGWANVPMICAREIPVPGSLPRCIRVLLQWNTDLSQNGIHHVYLGDASSLRPDLSES